MNCFTRQYLLPFNTLYFRGHSALQGTLHFRALCHLVYFAHFGYQRIWALCLSGHSTFWGTLPFKILWPSAHFALKCSDPLENLSLWAFCTFGLFALRGNWDIQAFANFALSLLPAAGTEGSSVLLIWFFQEKIFQTQNF